MMKKEPIDPKQVAERILQLPEAEGDAIIDVVKHMLEVDIIVGKIHADREEMRRMVKKLLEERSFVLACLMAYRANYMKLK